MPYDLEWEPEGVLWKFWGELTSRELVQSNLDIYGDPRFGDHRYQILDLLEVEKIEISAAEIRQLAQMDAAAAKINPRVKVAVVTNRALIRGLTNMYAIYSSPSPWKTAFFDTVAEARDWIDADRRVDLL